MIIVFDFLVFFVKVFFVKVFFGGGILIVPTDTNWMECGETFFFSFLFSSAMIPIPTPCLLLSFINGRMRCLLSTALYSTAHVSFLLLFSTSPPHPTGKGTVPSISAVLGMIASSLRIFIIFITGIRSVMARLIGLD